MNGKPESSGQPAQLSVDISASILYRNYMICIIVLLLRRRVNLLSAKCYGSSL